MFNQKSGFLLPKGCNIPLSQHDLTPELGSSRPKGKVEALPPKSSFHRDLRVPTHSVRGRNSHGRERAARPGQRAKDGVFARTSAIFSQKTKNLSQ